MIEGIKFVNEVNLKSKRVFIRTDFNVPLKNGVLQDTTRIDEAISTVNYAKKEGAKVILASHLGRPKGKIVPELSLKPVADYLSKNYSRTAFISDITGKAVKAKVNEMKPGDVILLENLRFHPGEEKNDPSFARDLSELCDVYINDAFGSCHRAHASVDGLARLKKDKAAGFLLKRELEYFDMILSNPKRPFYVVLGGAKVSDKIGVIEALLDKADKIFIGGAMAYTFLYASGVNVGKSLVEKDHIETVRKITDKAKKNNVAMLLPVDHVCSEEFNGDPVYVESRDIPENLMGLDIGGKTADLFKREIADAKIIMWNGPMGVFESDKYSRGTFEIATFIAELDAISIVGGGDSVSAIKKAGVADKISHVSTGGGASLELLENSTLVGIEALKS